MSEVLNDKEVLDNYEDDYTYESLDELIIETGLELPVYPIGEDYGD